eukprot:1150720-Pelagomonas_calceolata.AAC.4
MDWDALKFARKQNEHMLEIKEHTGVRAQHRLHEDKQVKRDNHQTSMGFTSTGERAADGKNEGQRKKLAPQLCPCIPIHTYAKQGNEQLQIASKNARVPCSGLLAIEFCSGPSFCPKSRILQEPQYTLEAG